MKLSSGQLFTIKLIKDRVDDKWPDGFEYAYMNEKSLQSAGYLCFFCETKPVLVEGGFMHGDSWVISTSVNERHPDYANSLVSRDEFMFAIENNI